MPSPGCCCTAGCRPPSSRRWPCCWRTGNSEIGDRHDPHRRSARGRPRAPEGVAGAGAGGPGRRRRGLGTGPRSGRRPPRRGRRAGRRLAAARERGAPRRAGGPRPAGGAGPAAAGGPFGGGVAPPPLMVRDNAVVLEPLPDFPTGTDTKIKHVEVDIRSVGRVEFLNHTMAWGGTGWVIASGDTSRVVVTNRHVAKLVARRGSDGRGIFLRSPATGVLYGIDLDFKEEVGSVAADSRPFEVSDILYLADDTKPDIALLRISGDDLPDPLPLSDDDPEPGDLVALVGSPAFDTRNDVNDQARYFHDIYDVKRFAPGKVMQALTGRTTPTHDRTRLGGNPSRPHPRRPHPGRQLGLAADQPRARQGRRPALLRPVRVGQLGGRRGLAQG